MVVEQGAIGGRNHGRQALYGDDAKSEDPKVKMSQKTIFSRLGKCENSRRGSGRLLEWVEEAKNDCWIGKVCVDGGGAYMEAGCDSQ